MTATTPAGGPPVRRSHRWATGIALAALSLSAVAGCGGSDRAGGPSPSTPPAPAPPSPKRPSARPTPSPTPTPSISTADGRDVRACADGDCQIAVSAPVTFPFAGPAGRATLAVTKVGPNDIEYKVTAHGNESAGGASGRGEGCVTVLRADGGGNSCGAVPKPASRPRAQAHAVVIQAAFGPDGTAILTLVSP